MCRKPMKAMATISMTISPIVLNSEFIDSQVEVLYFEIDRRHGFTGTNSVSYFLMDKTHPAVTKMARLM